ncbi:ABC transporter ATP-binding protein [Sphingobacteriales bacterium UPWRP_1]|nr:ABC transporter ATP-binding protein [Sphingobacteriales bacterium TSM_CSM]PSJ71816.1 ABC transporter ATP-binding protein [Sphingobacteriales bacterium UPWRP_1]
MSFWSALFGISNNKSNSRRPQATFAQSIGALKILPRFFSLIWRTNKYYTLANIVLRVLTAVSPLLTLYIGKLIIDEVILQAKNGAGASGLTHLWTLVAAEMAVVLASGLVNRLISLIDSMLGDLFANQTSVMLMAHAAELDLPQFEDAEFYDKLERARRQTIGRVMLMSDILNQFQDIITIVFLAAGLIVFNPWLIAILVVAVIPVFLSETYFNQQSYSLVMNWTAERRELDYLRFIGASDETAKEIKIFGLTGFLKDRFSKLAHQYYLANRNLAARRAAWGYFFNALGDAGYYVAYVVIILQTVAGALSVGDLTFLAGSFNRLRQLLQGILSRFSYIAQQSLYLKDFFDFFEMKPQITSPTNPRQFPNPIQQGFTFENIGFRYPNSDKWAIRNVSFTLHAGEKLALVGENGAGKTTLVKLLGRLYDPTEGRILLDGYDLREYSLNDLRSAIGVIFQDFVRFQMLAGENIAVGKIDQLNQPDVIKEAAEQSLADDVIARLPNQYRQMLGKRFAGGVELSGGEWQKVALSRAYMRNAQLLILDEPTAALDARAEYEVFQRFAHLTEGKSAVLISHRFSTVRMANRILVLKKGQMVEIGSHEELLNNNGLYAELFQLQAKGYL